MEKMSLVTKSEPELRRVLFVLCMIKVYSGILVGKKCLPLSQETLAHT
jgi:hypothetical protein